MSVVTPKHDVRRLQFSGTPHSLNSTHPAVAKSPYTPFSGRRSGSVPNGTPQASNSRSEDAGVVSVSFSAPESAEKFVNGGLDEALRGSSVSLVTAIRKRSEGTLVWDEQQGFLSEVLAALEVQLLYASEIMSDHSTHPYIRKEVQHLHDTLLFERNTWLLVESAWKPDEHQVSDLGNRRLKPDVLDIGSFCGVQGYVKCQRYVEWLERVSDEALERSGGPQLKPLDDPAYKWEYTASKVRGESLAMDYPLLGDDGLDEIERKAEARLSREVFRLVRAGRLDEAEEICRHVGQPWRAAALAGGKRCSAIAANGVKGQARKTWRSAAAAIARSTNAGIASYERAVCGALSGVLDPILAVSNTYEDQAWARLSVLLDSTADRIIEGGDPAEVKIEDSSILQAFRECEYAAEGIDSITPELLEGMRTVRSYLGMGPEISTQHRDALMDALARLSQRGSQLGTEWICRFAALICTFMKLGGLLSDISEYPSVANNFDSSIESFVRLIIGKDLDEEARAKAQGTILLPRVLVCEASARFLAELTSPGRVVTTYAELLYAALQADLWHEKAESERVGVTPREIDVRRTLCLDKAGKCFDRETLNTLVIAAVDLVWSSHLPDNEINGISPAELGSNYALFDEITEDDELVVRAIEFLIFPGYANCQEAICRGTRAARRFFLLGKRSAARHLIKWFPSDVLAQIQPGFCEGAVHELDCWRVYMEGVARHSEWNTFHSSQRPIPISDAVRAAALAQPGEVSYEVQASANIQLEKYVKEMEEYAHISILHREAAVESLRAALLFSGGWMNDFDPKTNFSPSPETEESLLIRKDEIKIVRQFGIPQLAALLHHVLHESHLYSDAVGLANLIADDSLRLYKNFGETELRAFLSRIADSAVLLADQTVRSGNVLHPYEGTFFEELRT